MALLQHRRQRTRNLGRPASPVVRAAFHDQGGRDRPRPLHVIWHRARALGAIELLYDPQMAVAVRTRTSTRVAVYVRISDDPELKRLGVRRQEDDCRKLAKRQ